MVAITSAPPLDSCRDSEDQHNKLGCTVVDMLQFLNKTNATVTNQRKIKLQFCLANVLQKSQCAVQLFLVPMTEGIFSSICSEPTDGNTNS